MDEEKVGAMRDKASRAVALLRETRLRLGKLDGLREDENVTEAPKHAGTISELECLLDEVLSLAQNVNERTMEISQRI